MSRSEDHLVGSPVPGYGQTYVPNVKVWRPLGRVTPSRLWLNSMAKCQGLKTAWQGHWFQALVKARRPNVKVWRLTRQGHSFQALVKARRPNVKVWRGLGRVTLSRLWLNHVSKCQGPKTAGQRHSFQALAKPLCQMSRSEDCLAGITRSRLWLNSLAKCQGLKTAWQGHMFQALVKMAAKCQGLKTAWQGHMFQALVKNAAKCQGLKTAWQGHMFQALVKIAAKCQGLKTAWQGHPFQALVKLIAKCQVFKAFWEMVQILRSCCTGYLCHSLQCKLFLRDWQTLDSTPRSIEICWNIGARECCSLAHDALRLQFFVQYQRWVKVMQGELRTFFLRKLLWNHSVHFPSSTGTIELQHASFPIQALYRKIE